MNAWAEGMSAALKRKIEVVSIDENSVILAGSGEGEPWRLPIEVNGKAAGWVEVTPGDIDAAAGEMVRHAVATLQSLAEIRNSMADLVRTTAHQWRELSLLYKFSDLVGGDQDPQALATLLVEQAQGALHSRCGAICFVLRQGRGFTPVGDRAEDLRELADWGAQLESGAILAGGSGPVPESFCGKPPIESVLVVPLRCRDQNYGALVVASGTGNVFNAEDLKLASLLARQAGLAYANLDLIDRVREHERMQKELELAAEIQASILPPAYTETAFLEAAGICLPAQWVGGDAFFVLPQEDGLLAGVADVSGHGISSALLMNAFAAEIEALSRTLTAPAELLAMINQLVSVRVGTTGLFVTVVLLRFRNDGSVTIANAGHPAPVVVLTDGATETVDTIGLPLGIVDDEEYEEVRLEIPPQASIVVFSDGITETVAPGGQMYGSGRLTRCLQASAAGMMAAEAIRQWVLDDVDAFREGGVPTDDVTLLVMRRKDE